MSAGAAHSVETLGQCTDGIGATLGLGPGIRRAHGAGQEIQALVQRHGMDGLQGAPDLGDRLPVSEGANLQMSFVGGRSVAPHGVLIEVKHQCIERCGDAFV